MINTVQWRRHVYIVTPGQTAPQVRGREEIWIGDRGQVTEWNGRTLTRRQLSAQDEAQFSSPVLFPDWFWDRELGLEWEPLQRQWQFLDPAPVPFRPSVEAGTAPFIDVEAVPVANRFSALGHRLRHSWQAASRYTHNLTRRLKLAFQAAWEQLTQAN